LDVFNLVEFDLINGRGLPIITGAQVIDPFRGIKDSLAKTVVAYFFAEAIDKMVFENDKDEELWFFLVSFLKKLDHNPNPQIISECHEYEDDTRIVKLFRRGQIRLLDVLGYLPETGSCKVCDYKLGDGELGAFNQELGGIVCNRCFLSGHGGILISREDFSLLNVGNVRNDGNVQFQQVKRSNNSNKRSDRTILDGMFEYISGGKFSSLDLLSVIK